MLGLDLRFQVIPLTDTLLLKTPKPSCVLGLLPCNPWIETFCRQTFSEYTGSFANYAKKCSLTHRQTNKWYAMNGKALKMSFDIYTFFFRLWNGYVVRFGSTCSGDTQIVAFVLYCWIVKSSCSFSYLVTGELMHRVAFKDERKCVQPCRTWGLLF